MCTCFVEKDNGPPPPPHIPFLFFYKHPRYWHNSYCNYPVVVLLQRYQELHFLGLARSFPQLAQFSPPPSLPPSLPLSALQGSSCLWGLVLASWFGSSGWLLAAEPALIPSPSSSPSHACVCVHVGVIPEGPLGL